MSLAVVTGPWAIGLLVLLLLVSTGLEKLSWLTRLSHKLIVPSYIGSLLRIGSTTAFFSSSICVRRISCSMSCCQRCLACSRWLAIIVSTFSFAHSASVRRLFS